MKTIATLIASLLLGGLLVAPASAEEPIEPAPCTVLAPAPEPSQMDGPSVLTEVVELRSTVALLERHTDMLDAQRVSDEKTINRQWKKIWRQEDRIKRLRAQLARR